MVMDLYQQFINALQDIYGPFDQDTKKFTEKSNSVIARELFYSDSQFSRMINQTASEGEYVRGIKVVLRFKEYIDLKEQRAEAQHRSIPKAIGHWSYLLGILGGVFLLFLLGSYANIWDFGTLNTQTGEEDVDFQAEIPMDHTLRWAFDGSDVKTYVTLNQLPEDCNFPCYRLQGRWKLRNGYKLPVYGERNGFHYVATDVTMYARCMNTEQTSGQLLEGYEYQKHEIWYDTKAMKIDSFLVAIDRSELRKGYLAKDFRQDKRFIMIAQVHTFFRNEFNLANNGVHRTGQVVGRTITYENLENLRDQLGELPIKDVEILVNNIIRQRVGDYSKPVQCQDYEIPNASFDQFEEGDALIFNCLLTTGRFPLAYQKIYELDKQFIKNKCRPKSARKALD